MAQPVLIRAFKTKNKMDEVLPEIIKKSFNNNILSSEIINRIYKIFDITSGGEITYTTTKQTTIRGEEEILIPKVDFSKKIDTKLNRLIEFVTTHNEQGMADRTSYDFRMGTAKIYIIYFILIGLSPVVGIDLTMDSTFLLDVCVEDRKQRKWIDLLFDNEIPRWNKIMILYTSGKLHYTNNLSLLDTDEEAQFLKRKEERWFDYLTSFTLEWEDYAYEKSERSFLRNCFRTGKFGLMPFLSVNQFARGHYSVLNSSSDFTRTIIQELYVYPEIFEIIEGLNRFLPFPLYHNSYINESIIDLFPDEVRKSLDDIIEFY
jgi:hypothetical protein